MAAVKTRQRRSDDILREASEHLYYEWSMLMALAKRLRTKKPAQDIYNAYLESFTVHARALVAFLYPENTRYTDTDVLANDYLGSFDWDNQRPAKESVLESVHDEVGRQIVHLSYRRREVGPEAKKWPVQEIAETLDMVLMRFTKLVPQARTCDDLRNFALAPRWQTLPPGPATPATNATISVPASFHLRRYEHAD